MTAPLRLARDKSVPLRLDCATPTSRKSPNSASISAPPVFQPLSRTIHLTSPRVRMMTPAYGGLPTFILASYAARSSICRSGVGSLSSGSPAGHGGVSPAVGCSVTLDSSLAPVSVNERRVDGRGIYETGRLPWKRHRPSKDHAHHQRGADQD